MQELNKENFYKFLESGIYSIVGFYNPLDESSDEMLDVLNDISLDYVINVGIVDVTDPQNVFVKNYGLDEKSPPIAAIFKNDTRPKRAYKDIWNKNQIMLGIYEELQPSNDEDD